MPWEPEFSALAVCRWAIKAAENVHSTTASRQIRSWLEAQPRARMHVHTFIASQTYGNRLGHRVFNTLDGTWTELCNLLDESRVWVLPESSWALYAAPGPVIAMKHTSRLLDVEPALFCHVFEAVPQDPLVMLSGAFPTAWDYANRGRDASD